MNLDVMVDTQIVARGVTDKRLLNVMRSVPREVFVPEKYKDLAFADQPLPIGYEQTISQPYIVALMTEMLKLSGGERVLEIGTGSGYQTAILCKLAKEVYSVERVEPLVQKARVTLSKLECDNVHVEFCDGYHGLSNYSPYDAIIVTCAPPVVPKALIKQLASGGRMVVPVGGLFQRLKIIERQGEEIIFNDSIAVRFVPMIKDID